MSLLPSFEYVDLRRVVYGEGAQFVPVCSGCGRFVKADPTVRFNGLGEWVQEPNATCKKCGRVTMSFEGFV